MDLLRSRQKRVKSAELVDIHVYLVPLDIWRINHNNLLNSEVSNTISAGIIRVHPEQRVSDLREEIDNQIGSDIIPRDYVFLKSVGRSITKLKHKQEYEIKAKHFLTPHGFSQEVYLLDSQDIDASRSSVRAESPDYNTENENISRRSVGGKYSYNPSPRYNQYSPIPKNSLRDNSRRESPAPQPNYRDDYQSNKYNQKAGRYEEIKDENSPNRRRYEPHHSKDNSRHSDKENGRPLSASWEFDQSQKKSPQPSHQPPPVEIANRPLSATPPLIEKSSNHKSGKYDSYHANEDSGIEGLTPEDHYKENHYDDNLDRRKREEEERRRREEEERRRREEELQQRLKTEAEEEERQRRRQEEKDREEWERRQREEAEKRRQEEEERRRREEEERRKEEEERRLREEELKLSEDKLSASDEDLNRFPSPPPLRMSTPSKGDSSSRQKDKADKEALMRELEQAREARKQMEKHREELVKKAKSLQNKMQNRRNHARDLWKKRYFEEKKRTSPLEEQCNRLRHELEIIHRRLMNTLEGPSKEKSTRVGELMPSIQSNYKIQATRLLHEIEDMKRRLENAKMKLTAEMKLRNQAETELRAMRAELTQKKINLTLSRNQQLVGLGSVSDPYVQNHAITPRS